MKKRVGFVSNSSSTSFIIRLEEQDKELATKKWKTKEEAFVFKNSYRNDNSNYLKEKGFKLKKEYNDYKLYEKEINLLSASECGLSRETCISYKEDLTYFIEEFCNDFLTEEIQKLIKEYGLENILYLRESDEGMGGFLPDELTKLIREREVLLEEEYH